MDQKEDISKNKVHCLNYFWVIDVYRSYQRGNHTTSELVQVRKQKLQKIVNFMIFETWGNLDNVSSGFRNGGANHRANDVLVKEGVPQILSARFSYGPLDMHSLSGERVDIHIMKEPPGGMWLYKEAYSFGWFQWQNFFQVTGFMSAQS